MLCLAWARSAREVFSFIITYFFTLFKFGSHMVGPIGSRSGRGEEISNFRTDRGPYGVSGKRGPLLLAKNRHMEFVRGYAIGNSVPTLRSGPGDFAQFWEK